MWWETSYKNGVKDGYNREWYKSGELLKKPFIKTEAGESKVLG